MHGRFEPRYLIWLVIFPVIATLLTTVLIRMIRFGGFKSAMFGASIEETIGEVDIQSPRLMKGSLKVHRLDGAPEREVGLELVYKSFVSVQMIPISLSAAEAEALISGLRQALASRGRPRARGARD